MTEEIFASKGEMGRLMAHHDWAASPVGPVASWPQSMRSAVRLLLRSRFPMVMTWGPRYTQFYNDAYSELIGDRHPAALGGDIRETLAEGWDTLGPLIESAMTTEVATWIPALQLLMQRSGYREEAYFSVSHAPAADDEGAVVGMFAVCTEVTEQVIGERRLQLLRDLPARAGEARTVQASCERALEVLAGHPLDLPFAAIYLHDGARLRCAGAVGVAPGALPAAVAPGDGDPWGLARAAGGEAVEARPRELGLQATGGPWDDPVDTALALPVDVGVLLAGVSPNRALDEGHRSFFELLAGQVAGAARAARAYEEERRRVEALGELDRAKTSFFANVSHEFRTPLTLLLGPVEDALADREDPLSPVQRERAELVARNARRMLKLVNGLLDFSRLQAGAVEPALRPVDLARATADLASLFRAAIERAGLRLEVDCPPLPGPVAVDPDAWEQIVLNLVSNAFKYTFTGEIRVSLREAGGQVVLEVADTGIGIAPSELPRLFERFHRVADTEARTHEGTGIGLALVRDLAELHGGEVRAESRPGRGSVFTVTLPAVREVPGAAPVPEPGLATSRRAALSVEEALAWEPAAPAGPLAAAAAGDAARPRVLVADDNADMRRYVERILAATCEVVAVGDGEAALEAAGAAPPDVVVADVMMPRLDGFGLLAALREDPRTTHVPVIVLSARAGPEAAAEGLGRGADDYLAKPFAAAELLARVHANAARPRRDPGRQARRASVRASAGPAPGEAGATGPATALAVARDPGELRLELPSRAGALRVLRAELRAFLAETGLEGEEADGLIVAACEAATNAIEHAQDATRPVIELTARRLDGRVRIDVRDYGRWRARGASLDRGRGSTLMEAYAEVAILPSEEGTLVTLTSRGTG